MSICYIIFTIEQHHKIKARDENRAKSGSIAKLYEKQQRKYLWLVEIMQGVSNKHLLSMSAKIGR